MLFMKAPAGRISGSQVYGCHLDGGTRMVPGEKQWSCLWLEEAAHAHSRDQGLHPA